MARIKFAEALRNLAQAMRDKGDLPAAIDDYRQLIALAPSSAEAHADLGFTLKRNDRLKEAYRNWRPLSSSIPISPEHSFTMRKR